MRHESSDIIRVYLTKLDNGCDSGRPLPEVVRRSLSSHEASRLAALRQPVDQWRLLAGRIVLHHALSKDYGLANASILGGELPWIKPSLPAGYKLDFSISHDGRWVGVALGRGHGCGFDIVSVGSFATWREFASEYLGREEIYIVESFKKTASHKAAEFWALKEAMLKSLGFGLSINPRLISIQHDGEFSLCAFPEVLRGVRFRLVSIDEEHLCAVAFTGQLQTSVSLDIECSILDLAQLLDIVS